MKRRAFIGQVASSVALLGCFPSGLKGVGRETQPGKLEKRSLGKTGISLSIVGFGAFALNRSTPAQAKEYVTHAFESGINYFDVAPSYGNAEELLGPALEPFRKDVFLACKTAKRTRSEAEAELNSSLRRLKTGHFDLYQLHHVTTMEEVETILGSDGAIHAFAEARKAGKVRLLGFSAHSVEAAMALMDRFDFDSIMFPVNYATWHAGNFGPQVLEKARLKNMGILALKAMAKRPWSQGADRSAYPNCWYEPMTIREEANMGLRFTLSHPVTAALHPADPKCMRMAIELAREFTPLKPEEVAEMKKRALEQTPIFQHPRKERAELHSYYQTQYA